MIAFNTIAADSWPVVERRPPLHVDMAEAIRRVRNSALWEGSKDRRAV